MAADETDEFARLESPAFIDRFRRGEPEAVQQLVTELTRPLFAFVHNIIRHREDAEDLLQDVFCRAVRSAASFDPTKGALRTWMYTIARNACRTALARPQRNSQPLIEDPPEVGGNPARRLEVQEQFAILDAALAGLPEGQQIAFVLCEVQGLSMKEAAEIENVPTGTIKSRVSRAREKLRSALSRQRDTNHEST